MDIDKKYQKLTDCLKDLGSAAVAFSGGADSTLLLKAAADALGDRTMAVTVKMGVVPKRELEESARLCALIGVRQEFIEIDELEIEGFKENPPDRCYFCKKSIFSQIIDTAHENGLDFVAEGSNTDDLGDHRPGMRAVRELGVKSPLMTAGLTKDEIRELSARLGLPTASKPSAACLASRIPYG